jgi:hypothetical protein
MAVPLAQSLSGARTLLRTAVSVDVDRRRVEVLDAAGRREELGYDRLVLAPGSVTRQAPVEGLSERGFGLKTLPQALALRDHVFQQLDIADAVRDAVARPLGLKLKGLPAKAVPLGYHVTAVPTLAGRARVAAELLLAAALPVQTVQLSPLPEGTGTLATETGSATG